MNEGHLAILSRATRVWEGASHPSDAASDTTPGLIQLCRDWLTPSMVMVEVGSFRGVSTAIFAEFVKTVYAVDAWTLLLGHQFYGEVQPEMLVSAERAFWQVAKAYPNIRPTKGMSVDVADRFTDRSLDSVYIDGNHAAFMDDVNAWRWKVRPGGLLMGHDYHGLRDYFGKPPLPLPDRVYPDTSWVIIVKAVR